MSLLTKILTPFLEVKKWLFGKRDHGDPSQWAWQNDPFYAAKKPLVDAYTAPSFVGRMEAERERFNGLTDAQRKNEKLASLARWLEVAGEKYTKLRQQKKRSSHVLKAIADAQRERMEIELGRRVYDPAFGAWVVKGEK